MGMASTPFSRRAMGRLALAAVLVPSGAFGQARLSVAAVNYPLAYFGERLAGDLAEVIFPVPPGTDPSFWRPGIADIAVIQAADLILLNGAGFADWTARTSLPRSRVVRTSAAFEDNFIATETVTHSHGDGGEHSHTGTASYVWLDFGQAAQQAITIALALTRAVPEAEEDISGNLDALIADLEALDERARQIGAELAGRPIIASHPRYQYFARAYGLDVDAVDWDAAAPPSDDQWQVLEAMTDGMENGIFLWEAAPGAEAADRIEALGLTGVVFPPLANRPAEGDFLSGMQSALDRLRDAAGA